MTEKRLVFEMGAIEFIEWLNKNSLYLAYVTAIMNKELKGVKHGKEKL